MNETSGSTLRAIVLASSFAFIVVQLDITIVNVALPAIGVELEAGVGALQWVVDAYTLGFAVFLLSAGWMGDRFGPRPIFLGGFALFTAASVGCALAPTVLALELARVLQGIGAALLVPSSLSILNAAHAHDKVKLAKAIGWWTAAGGVSIAAGPVVGGVLLATGGWRSIFWVNVPICIAGFALACKVVPRVQPAGGARRFDMAGQLLAILALTTLIGAVIEGPVRGWSSVFIMAALAVAGISGALFLLVERRAHSPMLPLRLFANAGFSAAVGFGVLVNFAYYGVIFILSFYLQRVRGYSALDTGLAFLPLTGTFILSNIASGWLAARTGLRIPMIVGGLIGAAGYALLGSVGSGREAHFLAMLPGLALIPAGMGLAVPAMTTSILGSAPRHEAGIASAVLNTARQVGGAMGVAVFGAMVAAGSPDEVQRGVQVALAICAAMLLAASALAYRYVARPAAAG
jgi:DHA2 family methylenomycin A resistance protein-like MFS transporter